MKELENTATGGRHSGRARPRRTARVFAGVVLVIGVVIAALPRLFVTPARLTSLIAMAVPELQADVRIASVRLGWFGPLVLEDVALVPRNGGGQPLAVGRIEASNGLASILLSAGNIGTLRIERPQVTVVFDAARTSNLEGLFAARDMVDPPGGRQPRPSSVRLEIEVSDAILKITGPWAQEPWVSDPIDVRAALRPTADGQASEWTIEPVLLLADARLEPVVAQGVLAYIAPVLADATRTSGRFSLRLDGGRFPVGDPASGAVAGELAMHEVVLGPGPLVAGLLQSLPGRIPAPPAIKLADESRVRFRLADRRVHHEGLRFGLPLARPGQRLDIHSNGSVGIDDGSLALQLSLPIPEGLPQDRLLLAALAGKKVSLGIGGVLDAPKVEFDGSIAATASDVFGDIVDQLRSRKDPGVNAGVSGQENRPQPPASRRTSPDDGNPDAATGGPGRDVTAADVIDVVGGLLEEIAKRRAERQAAQGPNVDQQSPRRGGRLLRRLLVPPGGDAVPPGDSPPVPAPPTREGE